MREAGLPSIDQLRVFVTVIDAGGFANAARLLQRTQSVISYTIANLEEQLNVVLLDRSKRKPTLTAAGQALLADARAVALKVDGLRARAKALADGLEAQVALAVDVLFPAPVLVELLEAFKLAFPTVVLRLHTEALGGVVPLVLARACQIGVGAHAAAWPDLVERRGTGHVTLLPVVAPGHPLARLAGPLAASTLREHTHLALAERSAPTAAPDAGGPPAGDWHLADPGSLHALLRAGLGWGHLPQALVRDDLADGRLVRLQLADGDHRGHPLHVLQRSDTPSGPAGQWLLERFAATLPALRQRGY